MGARIRSWSSHQPPPGTFPNCPNPPHCVATRSARRGALDDAAEDAHEDVIVVAVLVGQGAEDLHDGKHHAPEAHGAEGAREAPAQRREGGRGRVVVGRVILVEVPHAHGASDVADADLDDRHHRPEVNETAQRQLDLAELRHLRGLGRRAVASGGIHGEDDAANVDGGGDG